MLRRVKEILLLGFIAIRVPENGSTTPEKGFDMAPALLDLVNTQRLNKISLCNMADVQIFNIDGANK